MASTYNRVMAGLGILVIASISGMSLRYSFIKSREQAKLDEKSAMLADFQRGLDINGNSRSVGLHGTVVNGNGYVVMYPSGWNPEQLRLYGMSREQAQAYVKNEQKKIDAQR